MKNSTKIWIKYVSLGVVLSIGSNHVIKNFLTWVVDSDTIVFAIMSGLMLLAITEANNQGPLTQENNQEPSLRNEE